ncbi:MAG: type II toxin-antitoxin system VapC family toxin [Nitrospirae bacterium]|nr:type II toxin-antitoxin system VapC family toxin [Nitrospirota bacterium]
MKRRVFLDTNIFIYAFEFPESNSSKVITLLNKGQIEAVISERVLQEVQAYFKKFHSKDISALFRDYLLRTCVLVFHSDFKREMLKYKKLIKEKDLEQVAAVKKLGIKYMVAYDRDFEPFEEYITPKEFIKEFGLKPASSVY